MSLSCKELISRGYPFLGAHQKLIHLSRQRGLKWLVKAFYHQNCHHDMKKWLEHGFIEWKQGSGLSLPTRFDHHILPPARMLQHIEESLFDQKQETGSGCGAFNQSQELIKARFKQNRLACWHSIHPARGASDSSERPPCLCYARSMLHFINLHWPLV